MPVVAGYRVKTSASFISLPWRNREDYLAQSRIVVAGSPISVRSYGLPYLLEVDA
ncbi:hypothetical protein ARTHRO9AX_80180 [Arthrobacter sp. 9AX]|nr:hypothetical protein ARTHRO9AX_80180 [Arthrobacter sp. 9AX]